jgi:hypothetical protein
MRMLAPWAALLLAMPGAVRGDEAAARRTARAAMARYGPALVTVRLTVKPRVVYEGREHSGRETTMEVLGTVVAPDGLTVISDSSSNPEGLFGQREGGPRVETETSDVTLLLQDGRELPARFVLRDTALDLAFLAPLGATPPLACVRFEKAPAPAPLDDLLLLGRLGRSLKREVSVTQGRVRAVVSAPWAARRWTAGAGRWGWWCCAACPVGSATWRPFATSSTP